MQGHGTSYGEHQRVVAPSLIDQSAEATLTGRGHEGGSNIYGPKPLARIDSLECLARIDREPAAWVRWLGEDDPGSTKAVARRRVVLHDLLSLGAVAYR